MWYAKKKKAKKKEAILMSRCPQVFCEALDVFLGRQIWIAILILPVVVFSSWIRHLDDLAPFSLVANLCIFFCLAVILYEEIYSFL